MPLKRWIILVAAVMFAAGITLWLLTLAGPSALIAALPAFALAAVAVRVLGK